MTYDNAPRVGRRSLLVAAGGAALAGPLLSAAAPTAHAAAGGLPLTIVNNSGAFKNASVHVYVVGTSDGRQVRVNRAGKAVPLALADNKAGGFTDYAIPLAASGATQLSLPLMSGRIYVSLASIFREGPPTESVGPFAFRS